jgi:SAM-dependent methyltransferase
MESNDVASSTPSLWACPRCHSDLAATGPTATGNTFPLAVGSHLVHSSASLESYDGSCPDCGLPYTADGRKRFEYPYRQLLSNVDLRRFLRWSAAQNNGYVAYSLMRGSSCSVEGREDVVRFADFIGENLSSSPDVILDIGCGPLSRPAYLPSFPDATLVGLDPFDSEWSGPFIQGAAEFLPLKDGSVDLVVAATALDHALDGPLALKELARVTRKGGSLTVWDHTFESRWRRFLASLSNVYRAPLKGKLAHFRYGFLRERVRIFDNGIILWTPKGYADPFHAPASRRPSWPRKLRKVIEQAGFVHTAEDREQGFSHYVRS